MLQVDPPPKAVKVTISKRVALAGDELKAYEEEQEHLKKEEAKKAALIKEEEVKVPNEVEANLPDPMEIDSSTRVSSNGIFLSFSISCVYYITISLFCISFLNSK